MSTLLQDLRFGLRMLLASPGLTIVAMITLGIGIAASAVMFSGLNTYIIDPIDIADPDRVVRVWSADPREDWQLSVSVPDYLDWGEQATCFESLAAFTWRNYNLTGGDQPARVEAVCVTAGFFDALGATPALGRAFRDEEDDAGAVQAAILGHGLWQERFGGEPDVLGRIVMLNGEPYTVIGVMPAAFWYPDAEVAIWLSLPLDRAEHERDARILSVVAKLREGASRDAATAEMQSIAAGLATRYPDTNTGYESARVDSMVEDLYGEEMRLSIQLCFASGVFVLLIACVNVTNVMLARATARTREMAVRVALGAGRHRLVRQLLTEGLLLAVGGAIVGLIAAWWGIGAIAASMPEFVPRRSDLRIDAPVLLFVIGIAAASVLMFGLVPALRVSRTDVNEALKAGAVRTTGSGGAGRLRSALVVFEVALALLLLVGAGMMLNSHLRVQMRDPGVDMDGVLTARVALPESDYAGANEMRRFYDDVLARLRALPGVTEATVCSTVPLGGMQTRWLTVEGHGDPGAKAGPLRWARSAIMEDRFLDALGMRLDRGRTFGPEDREGTVPVALVNPAFVEKHFPDRDPIGHRVRLAKPDAPLEDAPWLTIIGITSETRNNGLADEPIPEVVRPLSQAELRGGVLTVRAEGEPRSLVTALRSVIREQDPDLPVYDINTLAELQRQRFWGPMITVKLLAACAAGALVMAMVGVYGVMAYAVSLRTQEIGIRMALGAQAGDVRRLVLRRGFVLALIGVAIGAAGGVVVTRVMTSLLYGVSATDPTIFVTVCVAFMLVALAASYLPARRATKVDPMVALRYE